MPRCAAAWAAPLRVSEWHTAGTVCGLCADPLQQKGAQLLSCAQCCAGAAVAGCARVHGEGTPRASPLALPAPCAAP